MKGRTDENTAGWPHLTRLGIATRANSVWLILIAAEILHGKATILTGMAAANMRFGARL